MVESWGGGAGDPVGGHPLEMVLTLGEGTDISEGRRAAMRFLCEQNRFSRGERAVQDTMLVVSELVTNVLKYAPGPGLLRVGMVEGAIRVEVWDSDSVLPAARGTDPGRIGQHGLEIVARLTRSLAFDTTAVGKRITAEIALS
ncbi:ATP-binding protein [Streptomyces sp. NPDC049813]|uniref:ATP-binding protein n=1 Tax=Streptomyces sp. NPDC049813 TaxID=3365597 RepID=UPI0037A2F3A0